MELWKNVTDYEKYEVSNLGRVRNKGTGLVLKPKITIHGYCSITLYDDDLNRNYIFLHRCVAREWCGGYLKELQINHINGVKVDNRATNLEWCTASENIKHSFETGLNKSAISAILTNIETNEIKAFSSLSDLAVSVDVEPNAILPHILYSKKYPFAGKYVIEFLEENRLALSEYKAIGRYVFVYDYLTKTSLKYETCQQAAYFTGIRSITKYVNKPDSEILKNIGYILNFNDDVFILEDVDIEQISINREIYRSQIYKPRSAVFKSYDYFSKVEHEFNTLDELARFIFKDSDGQKSTISDSISYNAKYGRTGLVRGIGVKSSIYADIVKWTEYTEEEILSNKHSLGLSVAFYRIHNNGTVTLVTGRKQLIEYFENMDDRPYTYYTLMKHLKSSNLPNLRVERLNKPIP